MNQTKNKEILNLTDEELEQKISIETAKKQQPNFYLADLLREKINRLGYFLIDTPHQTKIRKLKT